MSLTTADKNTAERISRNAHIPYTVASHFIGAAKGPNYVQLGILIEKHLLQGDQSEDMKEYGLTVMDVLTEELDSSSDEMAQVLVAQWNERLGYNLIKLPTFA